MISKITLDNDSEDEMKTIPVKKTSWVHSWTTKALQYSPATGPQSPYNIHMLQADKAPTIFTCYRPTKPLIGHYRISQAHHGVCHTPIFSAQRVRRLTRARPAFSRSILSHGIVPDFLIVVPSHVECLDLARHRPA